MEIKAKILESDKMYYKTSEEKCSRCGEPIAEDEVPLLLWAKRDANCMWVYCIICTQEVLS